MKFRPLLWSIAGALMAPGAAWAVVLSINMDGFQRRWDLATPELNTAFVSTNSVNPVTKAIRFYIAEDAYSAGNRVAELNAVRAAFGQWASVPGVDLRFEDAGLVPVGADVNPSDGTNVVYWTKTTTLVAGGTVDIGNALGVAFHSAVLPDNIVVGMDIVLNADTVRGYSWFTDVESTAQAGQFIEAVVLHETGHALGFEHSPLGAATMFAFAPPGINAQAGLCSDELGGIRFLYPQTALASTYGHLAGTVRLNGGGMLGASVILEDPQGHTVAATVSRRRGLYALNMVPPGTYTLRFSPLDPASATSHYLTRGREIGAAYTNAITDFLPTPPLPVTILSGQTNVVDRELVPGTPPFRITRIRKTSLDPGLQIQANAPAILKPGVAHQVVGVYGADLPSDATLTITGDGLTITPLSSASIYAGLKLVSVSVDVAAHATPGLRSFVLTRSNDVAYANGYVEVEPPFKDFNFDGLDDLWQRRYFALFTAPEAAAGADPDADGFNNRNENAARTIPTDAASRPSDLVIEQVTLTAEGSTLAWTSVPGLRYRVFSIADLGRGDWQVISPELTATNGVTRFLDTAATNRFFFYRVRVAP